MSPLRLRIVSMALLVGLTLRPENVSAHKFYASLAQVEKTPEGRIEVGIRFFPDDVEMVLSAASDRRIIIGNTQAFRDALMKYIDANLVIEAGSKRAKFRYVGVDPMVNLLWVFVEADWSKSLKGARLTNRLLLGVSADQINTMNLTEGDAKETLTFTATRITAEAFASKK